MRTIKFRGKCAKGSRYAGEWVYGSCVQCEKSDDVLITAAINDRCSCTYHVDPATVGQFTGLTDKNGKEIYEGDILKWYEIGHSDHDVLEPPEDYIKEFIGVVEFLAGGFAISRGEFPSPIPVAYLTEDFQANDDDMFKWVYNTDEYPNITIDDMYICEVVDNIHDNPELIEKGGEA